jgi:poly(3-hydroxybutyrate) depolymerase
MKYFITSIIFLFSTYSFADWKQETLGELSTFLYYPKASSIKSTNYKRALMINLHGCSQKADDLKLNGNWEKTADTYDMIVVLPKVPNGGVYMGCWDYYGESHTESNRHNGAIIGMIKALLVRPDLNIDANQIYVSGLSSGGGESMVLGCMIPDLIAGMGLNAGPSTGTNANEISRPQTTYDKMLQTCKKLAGNKFDAFKTQLTSIIYGNNDYVVSTQYDLNNAEIMRK